MFLCSQSAQYVVLGDMGFPQGIETLSLRVCVCVSLCVCVFM